MSQFDKYLNAVITRAEEEANEDGSPTVEASHLLLALAAEPNPEVQGLLGLDRDAVRVALAREFEHSLNVVGVSGSAYDLPAPSRPAGHPGLGTTAKLALERGFASVTRKKDVRPTHVLLGVLSAEVGTVPRALALAGMDREALVRQILETR